MFRRSRDTGASSRRTAEERARAAAERAARRAERLGQPVEPPPDEVFRLDADDLPAIPEDDATYADVPESTVAHEWETDAYADEPHAAEPSVLDPEPEGYLPDEEHEHAIFDVESAGPPPDEAIVEASRPGDAIRTLDAPVDLDDATVADMATAPPTDEELPTAVHPTAAPDEPTTPGDDAADLAEPRPDEPPGPDPSEPRSDELADRTEPTGRAEPVSDERADRTEPAGRAELVSDEPADRAEPTGREESPLDDPAGRIETPSDDLVAAGDGDAPSREPARRRDPSADRPDEHEAPADAADPATAAHRAATPERAGDPVPDAVASPTPEDPEPASTDGPESASTEDPEPASTDEPESASTDEPEPASTHEPELVRSAEPEDEPFAPATGEHGSASGSDASAGSLAEDARRLRASRRAAADAPPTRAMPALDPSDATPSADDPLDGAAASVDDPVRGAGPRRRTRPEAGPPTMAMPALGNGEPDVPGDDPAAEAYIPLDPEPHHVDADADADLEPHPHHADVDPEPGPRRLRRRRREPPPPAEDLEAPADGSLDLPPRQQGAPRRTPRRPLPPRPPRPPHVPRRAPAGSRPVTGRGGHPKRPRQPRTRSHSTVRWRTRALLIGVLVIGLLFVYVANATFQPLKGDGDGATTVRVPQNVGVGEIGTLLVDAGVIDSKRFFELNATLTGRRSGLRPGRYTLPKGMSNGEALAALQAGPAKKQVKTFRLTIAEGRSRRETAGRLKANVTSLEGDYMDATANPSPTVLRGLGAPRGTRTLEGFLFPSTYELPVGASGGDLVDAQLRAFRSHTSGISYAYAKRRKLTRYDVLIIASMVEREAMVAKERRLVASVIYNRLKAGMPLAIDATTRYETNNWSRPIRASELQSDSPYNTRNRRGLPPTPIGNPGTSSIRSAARPAHTRYLYYVAKPGTCGRHAFSSDFTQFERDSARYNAARAQRGGRSPTTC